MSPHSFRAAAFRPLSPPRKIHAAGFKHLLAVAGGVTLGSASVSCSSTNPAGSGLVSTSGHIAVSSVREDTRDARTEWNPESLPFAGDAREMFRDLGPDYFENLLRHAPRPEDFE